jgi:hypothetical protein
MSTANVCLVRDFQPLLSRLIIRVVGCAQKCPHAQADGSCVRHEDIMATLRWQLEEVACPQHATRPLKSVREVVDLAIAGQRGRLIAWLNRRAMDYIRKAGNIVGQRPKRWLQSQTGKIIAPDAVDQALTLALITAAQNGDPAVALPMPSSRTVWDHNELTCRVNAYGVAMDELVSAGDGFAVTTHTAERMLAAACRVAINEPATSAALGTLTIEAARRRLADVLHRLAELDPFAFERLAYDRAEAGRRPWERPSPAEGLATVEENLVASLADDFSATSPSTPAEVKARFSVLLHQHKTVLVRTRWAHALHDADSASELLIAVADLINTKRQGREGVRPADALAGESAPQTRPPDSAGRGRWTTPDGACNTPRHSALRTTA